MGVDLQSKLKNAIEYIKKHLKKNSLQHFPNIYEVPYLLRIGVRKGTNDVWAFNTIDINSKNRYAIYINSRFIQVFPLDRIIETIAHELMHSKEEELNKERYKKMTTDDTKIYRNTVEDEIAARKYMDIFDDELQSMLKVDHKEQIHNMLSRMRISVITEDEFRKKYPL